MTNFQFSKHLSILSLAIISSFIFAHWNLESPVRGQESSSTTETTASSEIKEKVEERIQKVLDLQIKPKMAYVGEITDINTILEIKTREEEKQAKFNDQTTFIGLKGNKIKPEDLKIGNYVIAMGYLDDNEVLQTSRLVVIEKPEILERKIVLGTISDKSSDGESILTVKQLGAENVFEVEITNKTIINQESDEEVENLKFEDLKENNRVIVIGTPGKNNGNSLTAKLIRVLPSTSETQAEEPAEEATASPTKAASQAAERE